MYGIYSLLDKVSNGVILAILIAKYSKDARALRYILALMPTLAALLAGLCTYLGTKLYSQKLAKISMGSKLIKVWKSNKFNFFIKIVKINKY